MHYVKFSRQFGNTFQPNAPQRGETQLVSQETRTRIWPEKIEVYTLKLSWMYINCTRVTCFHCRKAESKVSAPQREAADWDHVEVIVFILLRLEEKSELRSTVFRMHSLNSDDSVFVAPKQPVIYHTLYLPKPSQWASAPENGHIESLDGGTAKFLHVLSNANACWESLITIYPSSGEF